MNSDVEMTILDIRVELPGNQPMVLLHDTERDVLVRIWIGAPEASAIALAQHHVPSPRPMTHQLLVDAVNATGETLESVRISAVEDGVFFAELVLSSGVRVDARASDAIACALLAGISVYCDFAVIDEAGIPAELAETLDADHSTEADDELDDQDEEDDGIASNEESMDAFREFLDHVTPDDFAEGPDDDDQR
ncbi:MAG: bifunctional nuclease family protein [Micrococcaceae bacterium]